MPSTQEKCGSGALSIQEKCASQTVAQVRHNLGVMVEKQAAKRLDLLR